VSAVLASPAAKESQMDSVRALQHAASPGSGTRRRPQAAPGAYRPTRQQKGATKMILDVCHAAHQPGREISRPEPGHLNHQRAAEVTFVGHRRHDPRQLRVTVRGWERGMRLQHRRIERRHRVAPTNRMFGTTTPTPPIGLIRMSNIYRLKPFVLRRPWWYRRSTALQDSPSWPTWR
jgi:hypothetical protein